MTSSAKQVAEFRAIHCNPPVATLDGIDQFYNSEGLGLMTLLTESGSVVDRAFFPIRNSITDLGPLEALSS